ncbi:hypothetical protein BSM4216_2723 [Bacillus smithii]|nr:hypothetical protein BSM4216_2723 [Bacillus smithii]
MIQQKRTCRHSTRLSQIANMSFFYHERSRKKLLYKIEKRGLAPNG